MSNGILKRQNEEKSIAMLAAQRQLYSDAKSKSNWVILLSAVFPMIASYLTFGDMVDRCSNCISYILVILSMGGTFVLDEMIASQKQLAALIQQKFDVYVYSMQWDEFAFGKNINKDFEIAKYSKKILADKHQKEMLYNWYTSSISGRSILEGILLCQRENVYWDVGLRKKVKNVFSCAICLICFGMIIYGVYHGEEVIDLLCRLVFYVPVVKWLLDARKQIDKDIEKLNELDGKVNAPGNKTMFDLQYIQKILYVHRCQCYLVPDWLYKLFRDNDEDTAHRATKM